MPCLNKARCVPVHLHFLYVDSNVLIPRPETEELIDLVLDYTKDKDNISVCDIGSGSGNIPVTLKKLFLEKNKRQSIRDVPTYFSISGA